MAVEKGALAGRASREPSAIALAAAAASPMKLDPGDVRADRRDVDVLVAAPPARSAGHPSLARSGGIEMAESLVCCVRSAPPLQAQNAEKRQPRGSAVSPEV